MVHNFSDTVFAYACKCVAEVGTNPAPGGFFPLLWEVNQVYYTAQEGVSSQNVQILGIESEYVALKHIGYV